MQDPFVAFYSEHYRLVLTVAQQRLGGLSDAEDATAEVFRIALAHYRSTGELSLPWVYRTLRNVIGSEYRRRSRAPLGFDDPLLEGWDLADASDPDDAIAVRHALADLRDADREVIFMAYWEDITTSEMGAVLGITDLAVRTRLSRARRRLHSRLQAQSKERRGVKRDG